MDDPDGTHSNGGERMKFNAINNRERKTGRGEFNRGGKFTYDYYLVKVPGDCTDNYETLGHIAIQQAEESTHLYSLPSVWTAVRVNGSLGDFEVTYKVRRKRLSNKGKCSEN